MNYMKFTFQFDGGGLKRQNSNTFDFNEIKNHIAYVDWKCILIWLLETGKVLNHIFQMLTNLINHYVSEFLLFLIFIF